MNILEPDETNFNHLIQVDKNIKPYINNMKKILTNSIEILIADSFDRAIHIHSFLTSLDFPFSQWSKYRELQPHQIIKIFNNIPEENYSKLFENCVNVFPVIWNGEEQNLNFYNPFIIKTLFSLEAQSIMKSKGANYSNFQHDFLQVFVKNIPSYKNETAMFAFIELTHFFKDILPENQSIFNQLDDKVLNKFLSNVFNNNYTYYIRDDVSNKLISNKFFTNQCNGFFNYLDSSHSNKVFDHLSHNLCRSEYIENNLYHTLFPEEIRRIQDSKKEHDFLVLDNKLQKKSLQSKKMKI